METTCPNCKDRYETKYDTQSDIPQEDVIAKEQYMSGLCSRECYLEFVGSYISSWEEIEQQLENATTLYIICETVTNGRVNEEYSLRVEKYEDSIEFDTGSKTESYRKTGENPPVYQWDESITN